MLGVVVSCDLWMNRQRTNNQLSLFLGSLSFMVWD